MDENTLGALLKAVTVGSTVAGTAGNIYSGVEAGKTAGLQQQQLKNELSYQNDPAKFAALVRSFMNPLSQGLIQSVTRGADASGAAAGLSDSPGLMAYIVSQALAPYAQQNEQQAGAEASKVAFPGGVGTPNFPTTNLSPAYATLMKMFPDIFKPSGGPVPYSNLDSTPLSLTGNPFQDVLGETSSNFGD